MTENAIALTAPLHSGIFKHSIPETGGRKIAVVLSPGCFAEVLKEFAPTAASSGVAHGVK
jgi:hypothetical protein